MTSEPVEDPSRIHSITDTIAVLDDAVRRCICDPDTTVIMGESRGATVAAEVAPRRPDLVRAAALNAPVTDPLARKSFEIGIPEDRDGIQAVVGISAYLKALSAHDAVDTIVNVGGIDRIVPWGQGAKLVAALQAASPGTLTLLHHDPSADHFAQDGMTKNHGMAVMLAFLADRIGLSAGTPDTGLSV